jgi:hypothetical protein
MSSIYEIIELRICLLYEWVVVTVLHVDVTMFVVVGGGGGGGVVVEQ